MFSAVDGAFSGTAADPRTLEEPAVGTSPDDASERDQLNLVMNNFSPSEVVPTVDMIDVCSTSVFRGGGHDLASTPTPVTAESASFASVVHGVVLEELTP